MPTRVSGIFLGKGERGVLSVQLATGSEVTASHSTLVLDGDLETGRIVGSDKPPRDIAPLYARVELLIADSPKRIRVMRWKICN